MVIEPFDVTTVTVSNDGRMRLPTGESGSLRVLHLVIRIILSLLLFLDRISGWDAVSWAMTAH
jgi:hypothetical protein